MYLAMTLYWRGWGHNHETFFGATLFWWLLESTDWVNKNLSIYYKT